MHSTRILGLGLPRAIRRRAAGCDDDHGLYHRAVPFGSAFFRAAGKLIGHPHLFVSKLKARGLLLETGVDPTRLRAPRANQRRVTGRDEDRGPRAQRNSRYAVLRFAHVSGAPEYLKFLLFKNYYFTNNISPHGTSGASNATTAVRYNYLHASPRLS